ncbi:cysteine-rich receptor-like protein kinase 7 [Lolium rigidum]|uniref:cysteine-rich receptor-like protein kinase 7 n=1 Tax=Lolium rigidum TaxID=89674 RepID=UPI001F5D3BBB|nr:cysteine-rich receptor-like protein kinase 7 [Lolium rigidum]
MIEYLSCTASGNSTAPGSDYAANVNQFLTELPENTVSKNGGFFNGTLGNGTGTVYGLAMCSAEYSRADCRDCLTATAGSNTGSLPSRCAGNTTVFAVFDKCLVRYSDTNFIGAPETDVIFSYGGEGPFKPMADPLGYNTKVQDRLKLLTAEAATSPKRFAANVDEPPYALTQCTWDLPPDKCKQCLDVLSANASARIYMTIEGKRKSYSCTLRYSNTTFAVVPFEDTSSGPSSGPLPPTSASAPSSGAKSSSTVIIAGVVILALALLMLIWWIVCWYKWKHTRDSFGKGSRLQRFDYRDLSIATGGFSKENEIGKGGFGVVYSGSLKNKEVAVKSIVKDSRGEFKDFLAELGAIDGTGHVNLVRLEGWGCNINNYMFSCLYKQAVNLFLVYELVPNGNLHEHLYEKTEVLSWAMRFKIVKGLWSALNYLHYQCDPYILHRDIKPANILLDNDFNAKLGDFGLSRVAQVSGQESMQTAVAVGTRSYMDPLCMTDGNVNLLRSSDVYSFGIVLLEIAHGNNNPDGVRNLCRNHPESFVNDVADKKLKGQFDKRQMERVIALGIRCSEPIDESKRPSLDSAILHFLGNGGELPPPKIHEDEPHAATPA